MRTRFLIAEKTGTIHPITAMLAKRRDMIPAPTECVDLHLLGVESFEVIRLREGGFQFEPRIPPAWTRAVAAGEGSPYGDPSENEVAAASEAQVRIDAVRNYIAGVQETGLERVAAPVGVVQTDQEHIITDKGMVVGGTTVRGQLAVAGPLRVDDDFDLNINIRTMNKAELLGVARRIDGLVVNEGMKVAEIRDHMQQALDTLKSPTQPGASNLERVGEKAAERGEAPKASALQDPAEGEGEKPPADPAGE